MDNENIYDAAYSEAQLSGENETRYTFNEEIKKGNMRRGSWFWNYLLFSK